MDKRIDKSQPNTYKLNAKTEVEDRIEIEIGDEKQIDFKPQVKLKRWDNEANLSVRLKTSEQLQEHTQKGKNIEGQYQTFKTRFYELEDGLEFEIELPSKPNTNVFEFTLQDKELDYFYQPELTPEEIKRGLNRPENVIGSYAVYHKTKMNHVIGGKNYKTGKAFHIYRPKVHDAQGNEAWAELLIENGEMKITVPQVFLDNATYPVIVDPTFGYTSVGASSRNYGDDNLLQSTKGDGELGTTTDMSVYARKVFGGIVKARAGLYDIDDGGDFVAGTEEVDIEATAQWHTFSFSSPPSTVEHAYALAVFSHRPAGTGIMGMYYDSGAPFGNSRQTTGLSYPTWPSTYPSGTNQSDYYSIYATYGEEPVPIIIGRHIIPNARQVVSSSRQAANRVVTNQRNIVE